MQKHHRELARELFTFATELLEDTHAVATDGQSPHLNQRQCRALSTKLDVAAQQLSAAAETLQALANYSGPLPPIHSKRPPKTLGKPRRPRR